MEQSELENALSDLPLAGIYFHESVGSTNDMAAELLESGAEDLSFIIANEQTKGRGRAGRRWFTPPNSALAFSLVFHPDEQLNNDKLGVMSGLGALAVREALEACYNLAPEIKWPNDVLLDRKKVSGVLAEAHWMGTELLGLVLGIGINIAPSSIPPSDLIAFPATSVESVTQTSVDRVALLVNIVERLIYWRERLSTPEFITTWQTHLAYQNEKIQLITDGKTIVEGLMDGLDQNGRLKVIANAGEEVIINAGEIQLRPFVDRSPK